MKEQIQKKLDQAIRLIRAKAPKVIVHRNNFFYVSKKELHFAINILPVFLISYDSLYGGCGKPQIVFGFEWLSFTLFIYFYFGTEY